MRTSITFTIYLIFSWASVIYHNYRNDKFSFLKKKFKWSKTDKAKATFWVSDLPNVSQIPGELGVKFCT